MATFAVTLDNGSVITFEGNLTGDIVGGLTGWTQDETSESVVVTLVDPDAVPLTFSPPTGATADETNQITVNDDTGSRVFLVDAAGNLQVRAVTGSSIELKANDSSDVVMVTGAGALGFFGATPVSQPAAPTDAATIIAALQALGLVAT